MESAYLPPHVALVWESKPNGGLACDDEYSFRGGGVGVGWLVMDEYSFGGGKRLACDG